MRTTLVPSSLRKLREITTPFSADLLRVAGNKLKILRMALSITSTESLPATILVRQYFNQHCRSAVADRFRRLKRSIVISANGGEGSNSRRVFRSIRVQKEAHVVKVFGKSS
jgi:hypothetical protein